MSGLELFLTLVLYGPVAAFLILIFIPAALGKTFGFRKAYVQTLIYIFEVSYKTWRKGKTKHITLVSISVWKETYRKGTSTENPSRSQQHK